MIIRKLLEHGDESEWEWCEHQLKGRFQCEYGCCQEEHSANEDCCLPDEIGFLIMAVFGICFLVFIIASVVFCCVLACKQQPGRRGQVMQNRLGTMTATTTFGPQPPSYVPGGQGYPKQQLPSPVQGGQPYPQQQLPMATHPGHHQQFPMATDPNSPQSSIPSVPPPAYPGGFQQPYPAKS